LLGDYADGAKYQGTIVVEDIFYSKAHSLVHSARPQKSFVVRLTTRISIHHDNDDTDIQQRQHRAPPNNTRDLSNRDPQPDDGAETNQFHQPVSLHNAMEFPTHLPRALLVVWIRAEIHEQPGLGLCGAVISLFRFHWSSKGM
jgi:hypothetical protein